LTTNSVLPQRTIASRAPFSAADAFVYALILALSALPFFLYERAPDFVSSDVFYVILANSLLHQHSYSTNFVREMLQPPGLPIILAMVCATFGCIHDILIRTMPVFLAAGFLFSYEVIRRQGGRLIAALSCLLLAASPTIFPWVTSRLLPIFPYFFVTMVIFSLIPKLEVSQRGLRTFLGLLLLCFLLTAAVIIESAGIALIAAMLAWIVLSFFGNRDTAMRRLRRFLPIALVALLAEGLWLRQGGNHLDWPLPGYPQGYLAQLKVKDGNYPERGFATPTDVVLRVEKNLRDSSNFLGETLFQRWISPSWTSPATAGLAILILCGLWSSLWQSNSQLCALYFIAYEWVYLLWPWSSGVLRFALAVLPLACFYLAEGVLALRRWSVQCPRKVATLFLPLSIILALAAAMQGWSAQTHRGFQEKIAPVFWVVCAILCVKLIWTKLFPSASGGLSRVLNVFQRRYSVGSISFHPAQLLLIFAAAYLTATGVAAEIPMGRENLLSGWSTFETAPEIKAARWIEAHTDPGTIIASSQGTLIYYYSKRRVMWFPPISNPKVLMEGIRKYQIRYLVVINRNAYYFLPPETTCFDLLYKAYPQTFQLAEAEGQVRIYEVLPDATAVPGERTN
jgi:hypothetical protein